MTFLQAVAVASSNAEPIVTTALIAGAGAVLLWFANRFMKMLAMMQSVSTALFGDPNSPVPNGVIRKLDGMDKRLTDHAAEFVVHVQDEGVWKRDMYAAIHTWNEHATQVLATVSPVTPPPLALPAPPERRKKPR